MQDNFQNSEIPKKLNKFYEYNKETSLLHIMSYISSLNADNNSDELKEHPTNKFQSVFHRGFIRDEDRIHRIVRRSVVANKIIKHPMFIRLSKIKQLGTMPLHKDYKQARHTRFEHSCGVAYLALVAAQSLQSIYADITDKEVLLVEIAGLLHDIGHCSFSHSFDTMLKRKGMTSPARKHEYRSQVLVRYVLTDLMKNNRLGVYLDDADIRLIQYFIDPKSYNIHFATGTIDKNGVPSCVTKFYMGLQHIVNSDITVDVDKLDYIYRDTVMLGWDTKLDTDVDIIGMLKRCHLIDNKWTFNIDDYSSLYELISLRFLLYRKGYTKYKMSMYEDMITDALLHADVIMKFTDCAKLDTSQNIDKFRNLTDQYLVQQILNSKDKRLSVSKNILENALTQNMEHASTTEKLTSDNKPDREKLRHHNIQHVADKSAPLNLLPRIVCHDNNGKLIKP